MKTKLTMTSVVIAAAMFIGGCASDPYQPMGSQTYPAAPPSYATHYGVIDSIQVTRTQNNEGSGVGAVLGGVVGGILGNQVGAGSGKAAATAAGVVGGAMVGNQIEKNNKSQGRDMYQIGIRLDNGGYQTIVQDSIVDLQVGSRAHVQNGRVYRY